MTQTGRALNLAFYMPDLSGGGVERMRLALMAALRARGMTVTLIVQSDHGPLRALLPADLAVMVLGTAGTVPCTWRLARLLRRLSPDVLVSSLDHNNLTAMLAARLAGGRTRVVICQHNALSAEAALGWKYRLVPALYRLMQGLADGIVAVSDGAADDLAATARIPRRRIATIYNPVIDAGFRARSQAPAPHPWLANGPPVFMFAGRLTPQKDPMTLLRAMARLLERMPARLILLGEGPLRAEIQAEAARLGIEHAVCLAGFQANPLPWIARARALVLPSRYEGLGNVIVEALGCGTPVVASDCPWGPAEILQGGRHGLLLPPGNHEALASAMRDCLGSPWDREVLRARAARFSAAACAEAHLALFGRILARDRRTVRPVFGMRLWQGSATAIVERLLDPALPTEVRLVVTPNIDHLRLLRGRPFARAYAAASLACADGFPVVLYARLRGLRLGRVTGCEIFHRIANHPRLARQLLFLVVESEETAQAVRQWAACLGIAAATAVAVAPPDLLGDPASQADLADSIRAHGATLLIVTLGAPVSECFVHANRASLPPCWALCLGQAVRVELGLARRAPPRWQALGLEWLWRLRAEPGRLAGRYGRSLAWFPLAMLLDLLGRHASGEPQETGSAS